MKAGEAIKVQLGAQIDGFGSIVCDTIFVPASENANGELPGRQADLALATHYANELLLRLIMPPGLLATGTAEEKEKASKQKQYTQSQITQLLEKVVKSYDCNLVENTTCWLFDRNEIEGKKKIILAPGEGVKGDGLPEVGEVWGIEVGVSLGSGKVKSLSNRATLHRRTTTTYGLKRPSSRATLSEVVKKFGTFPFSLRQLEDERAGKVGVVECVRGGVIRQYEVIGEKDNEAVSRLFSTVGMYIPKTQHSSMPGSTEANSLTQPSPRTASSACLTHQPQSLSSSSLTRRLPTRRSSRSLSNLLPRRARTRTRRRRPPPRRPAPKCRHCLRGSRRSVSGIVF